MTVAAPRSAVLMVVICGLALLTPFSSDIFLPSIPAMTVALATDHGSVQLALSLFIFGIAVSQLVIGPLSDRHGRRRVLLVSLALYVVAGVGCTAAPNIETLLAARMVQSVGGCAGMAVGRAVVRDSFEGARAAQAFAYVGTALAAGPMLSPIIGGQLEIWLGWRSSFGFLVLFGAAALALVWYLLPETNTRLDADAVRPRRLARNYATLLASRHFLGYVLAVSFCYAGIFAFISGSPFVLIEMLGVRPDVYGLLFCISLAGYGGGAFTASQVSRRVGIDRMILAGGAIAVAAGLAMVALALAGILTVWGVVAPVTVFAYGTGLVFPNAQAGAIGPFPEMAGTASALLGSIQMAAAAVFGALVGQLHDGTQMPMVIMIAAASVSILVSFYVLVWRRPLAAGKEYQGE